jgi:hypothetical protein
MGLNQMTTFYKKVGRRYIPVREYDSECNDAYQHGTHLVVSVPGHKLTRFNIEPELAPLIAAGTFAIDKISAKIVESSNLRLCGSDGRAKTLTKEQREAWEKLVEVFGDGARQLEWPSAREAAEAGVNALISEAEKKLENPLVKKAYEQFLMVYKLAK